MPRDVRALRDAEGGGFPYFSFVVAEAGFFRLFRSLHISLRDERFFIYLFRSRFFKGH